ncbi:MAG: DUF3990 domain-containing protein [Lachnospiraceae bacterium]|nr:DUF3990 domain-containing protein [Lachnospiraceae bacterium]
MRIYHGSYIEIQKPDVTKSRNNVDFGKGFYTTPIKDQAIKWAKRFKKREGQSIVSIYEMDEIKLWKDFIVKEFSEYSDEWLDYILACRRGEDAKKFDVVIGGVANDKVFDTIELFFDGLIEKSVAIERLRYEKPNLQICFCSQAAIEECVTFVESEVL